MQEMQRNKCKKCNEINDND